MVICDEIDNDRKPAKIKGLRLQTLYLSQVPDQGLEP